MSIPDKLQQIIISKAIGLSATRMYQLLDEAKIPYLRISKRKIIFKEHLLQGLSGKRIFTDVAKLNAIANLPDVFKPSLLQKALGISHGFAYSIAQTPGFPVVKIRGRMVINKQGLICWIRKNELYTRKED